MDSSSTFFYKLYKRWQWLSLFVLLITFTNPALAMPSDFTKISDIGEESQLIKTAPETFTDESNSEAQYKVAITAKIQQHLTAPKNKRGKRATLSLQQDSQGKVLHASATGADDDVNKAVVDAAYRASPLTIDLNNPEKCAHCTVLITFQKILRKKTEKLVKIRK